jgi:hypothetical protein
LEREESIGAESSRAWQTPGIIAMKPFLALLSFRGLLEERTLPT